ncbi:hypothetical protein QWJ20_12745 [Pectobacterium sp. S5]|uniref:hypothetical protein n=1 Tax=Pectobacterium TaxID=122277 RepID=UPI003D9BB210
MIAYDESGDFTVNERRAAWLESYDQEQQWKRAAIAKMDEKYNRTGQVSSGTLSEILKHYTSFGQLKKHNCPKDTMRSYCLRFKLRKAVAYLRA